MARYISDRMNPDDLKKHPRNIPIYGDKPDSDFVESVRKNGVLTPVLVTGNNLIVSGHQRVQAAKIVGLKDIPVRIDTELQDENDILEALISSNEQRHKTTEQRTREYQIYKEIEEARARERLKTSTGGANPKAKKQPVPNLVQAGKKSANVAAEKAGMSRENARKSEKVVEKIDQLEQEGRTEEAEDLRGTLNKSVNAAAKKAKEIDAAPEKPVVTDEVGNELPEELHDVFSRQSEFASLIQQLGKIQSRAEELQKTPSGSRLSCNRLKGLIRDAQSEIKYAKPHSLCPYCGGEDGRCESCKGSFWVGQLTYKNAPKD